MRHIDFDELLKLEERTGITITRQGWSYQGALIGVNFEYQEVHNSFYMKGDKVTRSTMLPLSFNPEDLPSHIAATHVPINLGKYNPVGYGVYHVNISLERGKGVSEKMLLRSLDEISFTE